MAETTIETGTVAGLLRNLRTARGLSIGELAIALDCDKSLISRFENGTGTFGRDMAKRVSEYFGEDKITRDQILFPELYAAKKPAQRVPGKKAAAGAKA